MNETDMKGILLDKIPLNAANIAFARKLEEFDCAVVMDEQGNDKSGKAQLAILNALDSAENPSALIITTKKLMYVWYQTLITGIGVDFKFITPDERSINYFSPKLENFYITCTEAGNNPIFKNIGQSGLVWDLVIIDGGLSKSGINTDVILDSFDIKAKKLVVFAPYLRVERDAAEKLSKLPEKFLADTEKAAYFTDHFANATVLNFDLSTPFTRYYGNESLEPPEIRIINYKVTDEVLKAKSEQPGSPLYYYGGNIFEELTLDMRKLYIADRYDDQIVKNLRECDTKMNAYLNELDSLLEDPANRIITYFSSEKTLDYIFKILSSSSLGLKRITAVKKSSLYNIDDMLNAFKADSGSDIRIILSLDDQDEQCEQISSITHVINYELPNSPLTLHRRYKQGGRNGFANPEFIIFKDDTDKFDGRMLNSALALNICDGFSFDIPGRNIYIFIDKLDEILADMMCELEDAENLDEAAIAGLTVKYNLRTTPDRAKIALCYGRDAIKIAFELPEETADRETLAGIFRDKLEPLRESCCYFDFNGHLVPARYDSDSSRDFAELNEKLQDEPLVVLRDAAREALDSCGSYADYARLLCKAEEKDKNRIYFCTWRYLAENRGLTADYNDFLKEFCEEVI